MIDQNQILWDERNLTELQSSCKNKNEQETSDITKDIKTSSTPNDWRNIIDPKLRKKMRQKIYYEKNKEKTSEQKRIYRETNKDKMQAWRKANKTKIKEQAKAWRERNKEKIKALREANKDKSKAWREANKEKIKAYRQANRDKKNFQKRNRRKTDIQYKLTEILRCRLSDALKNNYKSGSAIKDLGCTVDKLKLHLESKFKLGMTWDNHGVHGWHIDHIKPLSSFDLTDRNQLLQACHYTNLQPLWAKDNIAKKDKIV